MGRHKKILTELGTVVLVYGPRPTFLSINFTKRALYSYAPGFQDTPYIFFR
jgi:hypothetical protein